MCIICYKPAGASFPTKRQFKTMFKNNPDGCGFMYPSGDGVNIDKGFMTYSEFRQALSKHLHEIDKPFVFHFRIATHGGINEEMTQPFPLSDSLHALRAVGLNDRVGIAHNGIIPLTNDARKLSDTAQFIRDYVTRLYDHRTGFDDITLNIIEACIGSSRMAILENTGACHLLGHGWKKCGALYFSNDSYIDYKTAKKQTRKTAKLYSTWDAFNTQYIDYDSFCDGYCDTCVYRDPCWNTAGNADVGINSIE